MIQRNRRSTFTVVTMLWSEALTRDHSTHDPTVIQAVCLP
jgi:hypothetical protein